MAAPKGTRPPGGSRKGRPNKISADVKAMILAALDGAGGVEYLIRQADQSPAAFMALVGKVLPLQLRGGDDGPIEIRWQDDFADRLREARERKHFNGP